MLRNSSSIPRLSRVSSRAHKTERALLLPRDYVAYTQLHNICGTTALSVPLHWDTDGLPIGSQFAARMGAEATLLALAYELEEARPWATKRPPLFVT